MFSHFQFHFLQVLFNSRKKLKCDSAKLFKRSLSEKKNFHACETMRALVEKTRQKKHEDKTTAIK